MFRNFPEDNRHNPYDVHLDPVFEVRSVSTLFPTPVGEISVERIPRENIYLNEESTVLDPPAQFTHPKSVLYWPNGCSTWLTKIPLIYCHL